MERSGKQKSIFVTGAASGIGRATALLFAQRGWFVGLYDLREDDLAGVAQQIEDSRCCYQKLDVADRVDYERAIRHFAEYTRGTMDVLFNCAGIISHGPFERVALDDLTQILKVNVGGTIIGIHLSFELLRNTPGARIINMSSASAFYGTPELAVYSASKFAIRGLTEALDIEFERHGIAVSDIMPLFVGTPMVANQAYKLGSQSVLGIGLTPLQVAALVWKAVHRRRVHWHPTLNERLIDVVSRLSPCLQRTVMRLISGIRE